MSLALRKSANGRQRFWYLIGLQAAQTLANSATPTLLTVAAAAVTTNIGTAEGALSTAIIPKQGLYQVSVTILWAAELDGLNVINVVRTRGGTPTIIDTVTTGLITAQAAVHADMLTNMHILEKGDLISFSAAQTSGGGTGTQDVTWKASILEQ
jgi:hypothetical protein